MTERLEHSLRKGGGYRDLKCYQLATVVYDATVVFCNRCIDPRSRTKDQMIQAARSATKNIAEGSRFSKTSKTFEIALGGTARASLEELLGDYEDFLRQNNLDQWTPDHPKATFIRNLYRDKADEQESSTTYATYRTYVEDKTLETAANTIICLIHQSSYLLDRLIGRQVEDYVQNGDLSEQLTKLRRERQKQDSGVGARKRTPSDRSDRSDSSDTSK